MMERTMAFEYCQKDRKNKLMGLLGDYIWQMTNFGENGELSTFNLQNKEGVKQAIPDNIRIEQLWPGLHPIPAPQANDVIVLQREHDYQVVIDGKVCLRMSNPRRHDVTSFDRMFRTDV